MAVLIIGITDPKNVEFAYTRDRLTAAGVPVLVADGGSGKPAFPADSRLIVDIEPGVGDRSAAVALAAKGAEALARKLHAEGRLDGIFGLGGSAGTVIGMAAMRAVPLGIPKVMVSTLATADVRSFGCPGNVDLFHSVVDITGLNRLSRLVLDHATASMQQKYLGWKLLGMIRTLSPHSTLALPDPPVGAPAIATTRFTTTFPGVRAARAHLQAAECEVTFLASGRIMEERIAEGQFAGVLDLTTTELADELIGGDWGAGPDRLTAAAMKGVPQVISVGALDTVKFFPRDRGLPAKFEGRRFRENHPSIRLMRTTPEENDRLGLEIAQKACAAKGPTAIILPLRGVSSLDIEGGPFWWPEADAALFQSLRNWVAGVELIELDLHINDPAFGRIAAETLLRLMGRQ